MSSVTQAIFSQTGNDTYYPDRTPPFIQGLASDSTPSQRVDYLEPFRISALAQDELIELNYLILREKSLMQYNPNSLAGDQARLMQHPYSTLAVAYKQLGAICYEHHLFSKNDKIDFNIYGQFIGRIDDAVALFRSRSVGSNAAIRYLTAASSLRCTIEMHAQCPLLRLVRNFVEKSLIDFDLQNKVRENVEAIFLTIHKVPENTSARTIEESITKGDLACVPQEEISYSFLDQRIVQLWYELIGQSQTTKLDFVFFGHIQTHSTYFNRSESVSVSRV